MSYILDVFLIFLYAVIFNVFMYYNNNQVYVITFFFNYLIEVNRSWLYIAYKISYSTIKKYCEIFTVDRSSETRQESI